MFGYKVKEQLVEKRPGSMLVAVFIFESGNAVFCVLDSFRAIPSVLFLQTIPCGESWSPVLFRPSGMWRQSRGIKNTYCRNSFTGSPFLSFCL